MFGTGQRLKKRDQRPNSRVGTVGDRVVAAGRAIPPRVEESQESRKSGDLCSYLPVVIHQPHHGAHADVGRVLGILRGRNASVQPDRHCEFLRGLSLVQTTLPGHPTGPARVHRPTDEHDDDASGPVIRSGW